MISVTDSKSRNRDTVADARSLYLGMTDFEFIMALVITKNVMAYTKTLTIGLQGRGMDVVNAYEHVAVVTKCLKDVRADIDQFNKKWLQEATELAQEVHVEPSFPRTVGHMQHRTNCPALSTEEYYKRNLAIPLVDHFLSEFNHRFSDN